MTIGQVGGSGLAPSVVITPYNPEQRRYERIWQVDEYRVGSPGERSVFSFLAQTKLEKDAEVIDFGCGTGRAGWWIAALGKARVTLIDFAGNCLDPHVAEACAEQPDRIKFVQHDLTKTIPFHAAYGICCDVLEHIPEQDVRLVLKNILLAAQHVYFAIATVEEIHGDKLGDGPLHLTVKPPEWWLERLREAGAVIHWQQDRLAGIDGFVCYCTAWRDASDVVKIGHVNVDESTVDEQVRTNIEAGWKHAQPYDVQARELILLAGGPSMNDHLDEIKALRAAGCGLVTVNGAYGWALDNGLEPSMQIVLDARAFNQRFTRPVTPYTKYMIGSQVHPSTLEGLPHDRTFLWHSALNDDNTKLVIEKTGHVFPVPGGSTVVLRSICLLRMLGFKSIHFFGFDSCVRDNGSHHAYAQSENDGEPLIPVVLGGKSFQCTPWMLSQASEFRDMVSFMGDEIECAIYGDGLIAQMVKTGASFSTKEE